MTEPAIDRETFDRLVDITGGDLDFIDELVDTYLDDGAAQLEGLRAAAAAGDPEGIVRPAHTLKSSSGNVGALGLAEMCRDLEADARNGSVPDAVGRVAAAAAAFGEARHELLAARSSREGRAAGPTGS